MDMQEIKDNVKYVAITYGELAIYILFMGWATVYFWQNWGWKWALAANLGIDLVYCIFKMWANPALFHYCVNLGRQLRYIYDNQRKKE